MSKLEKYPKYKDSGVEWLGKIPEGWEVKKIKYLFNIGRGRVISQQELDDNGIYPVYSSQTKNNGILGYIKTYDFNCKQITWTTDGANAGTVFLRDGKYNCTNVCGTLQQKSNDEIVEYINYSLQIATKFYKRPDTNGAKIMNNEMAEIIVTYPPKQEQIKIANYLDQKTAQIDKAISLKEQMIERLKERRQILINDVVTKGLDKTVKMKDSGVEWIGEIPEHWEVLPGFRVYKENKTKNIGMIEERVLSLSYGKIVIKPKEKLTGLVPESFETYQIVKPGDIIIRCMDLQNDQTSLRIGIARNDGIITSAYLNLNVIDHFNSEYLHYYLHMLDITKVLYKFGTGLRQNLSYWDFKRLPVLVPSIKEQEDIVKFIEMQTRKIDTTIILQQKQTERLKEYKAMLIDSVVTGKVKVI